MPVEIERKFLVGNEAWREASSATRTRQGYLAVSDGASVRVRHADNKATLTVKSGGASLIRAEFEYEIPPADAVELLEGLCSGVLIDKMRYALTFSGKDWIVDEYFGHLSGLVVAEIELRSENEIVDLPPWVETEVTGDRRYLNSSLSLHGLPEKYFAGAGDAA